ncbi:MAG TPA: hypothetical protein VKQ06_02505 [Gammaproteobacteria bacterium]|nr:hypothetical protein [Gammaproteobacteria bacterium]
MELIARNTVKIAALLAFLMLGACAHSPTENEQSFGDSVRNMVRAQTYDPSTLSDSSGEIPESTDGQKLGGALETYRDPAGSSEAVSQPINISVGGGQ